MKLDNIQTIKGYNGGTEGNMLVSYDPNLVVDGPYDTKIKLICCTAYVKEHAARTMLRQLVDSETTFNRIIVVGPRFMKLCKKTQLALLAYQNNMNQFQDSVESNITRQIYGEVETIKEFGRFRTRWAFRVERAYRERTTNKEGAKKRKQYKEDLKEVEKLRRHA